MLRDIVAIRQHLNSLVIIQIPVRRASAVVSAVDSWKLRRKPAIQRL
jgi:hypothetical protein